MELQLWPCQHDYTHNVCWCGGLLFSFLPGPDQINLERVEIAYLIGSDPLTIFNRLTLVKFMT